MLSRKVSSPATEPATATNSPSPRPRLGMIWVKEWDGDRFRLVAHWTAQD